MGVEVAGSGQLYVGRCQAERRPVGMRPLLGGLYVSANVGVLAGMPLLTAVLMARQSR